MASVIFISFVISFCPLQYEELFSQSDLASSNARQNYPQILHLLILIFIFFRLIRKKVTSYGLWIFCLFWFLTRKVYCVLSQGTFFKEKAYPWILQCLSSASCSHDGVYDSSLSNSVLQEFSNMEIQVRPLQFDLSIVSMERVKRKHCKKD